MKDKSKPLINHVQKSNQMIPGDEEGLSIRESLKIFPSQSRAILMQRTIHGARVIFFAITIDKVMLF